MLAIPELVAGLCARSPDVLDADELRAVLGDVARVQSWLEFVRVGCVRRLEELSTHSGRDVVRELAGQQRCPRREAQAAVGRAKVIEGLPAFEAALALGRVSAGHLDVLAREVRPLEQSQRDVLVCSQDELIDCAARQSPEEFGEMLRQRVRLLHDGVDELESQRRATRLRFWHDPGSGMFQLRGQFDPVTGSVLRARLDGAIRSLTASGDPDTCPDDPLDKLDHLRGLALASLARGTVGGQDDDDLALVGARYDLTIVVDAATLTSGAHPDTILDTGDPDVPLPVATVQRIGCLAELTGVLLDDRGVPLKLGRSTRLASRSQRRALRTMYPTCAMPGCRVPSRYCQPHHVGWWRHGGSTDIDNLLPVCSRHHHAVHEGGWQIALRADHSYTITYPDGTSESIPPPAGRRAASRRRRARSAVGRTGSVPDGRPTTPPVLTAAG